MKIAYLVIQERFAVNQCEVIVQQANTHMANKQNVKNVRLVNIQRAELQNHV
jgi:hypothetical protein